MNIKTFIDKPVLSAVISIVIVIVGIISLTTLPIEQYPDIAPPTVMVTASYPGASAETVQKSVIAPLEQAINGAENMMYMTSECNNTGVAQIMIYFRQGTDPDMAAVNVQNRVSRATGTLPNEVIQIGISTIKRQNSMLRVFSLYSPNGTYDEEFLSNYMKINIEPEIARIQGVGDIVVFGASYSMRIWLQPDVLAQHHLVPSDVVGILAEQNIEAATGILGENADNVFQYTMKYSGRLMTPEEFGEIVISAQPDGELLYLKDIADIELGREDYAYICCTNGAPGISAMIYQTAGSNSTEINKNLDTYFDKVQKELPQDIELISLFNTDDFLYASINEVVKTLIIAIILVIIIVFFFLQSFRATLIPLISVIVSLVGTFAFLKVAHFSLNLLTLFSLVLVIGAVVDNAIVVVEAVQARFDLGYKSAHKASIDAMHGLTAALVSTSLVFMAVFIPICFMGGTTGTFYTQFGLSMAVAVGISLINALTLTPALCAILLKPTDNNESGFIGIVKKTYNVSFNALASQYKKGVLFFVKRKWIAILILILSCGVLVYLMKDIKKGFIPDEDVGTIFVNVNMAPGSSLNNTETIMLEIEKRVKDIPGIASYSKTSGHGLISGQGVSYGEFIIKLKPWEERTDKDASLQAIINQFYARTSDIKDAQIFAFAPPLIPGYGTGNGFEFSTQDKKGGDLDKFVNITNSFLQKLRERPEIASAYTTFNVNYPQYRVEVDIEKCKRAGVSPRDVLGVIGGYCGGIYASNINRFTKVYRVMVQARPDYRLDKEALNNMYVRIGMEMAPVSQFVTLNKVYGAEALKRFNLYNSIGINGMPADGYSSSDAINAIKEVAAKELPQGYGFEFAGMTREENSTSNNTIIIFIICFVFIYLILAALYESFLLPLAVFLAVPCGLMGCFLFAKLMGHENNIYLQTGMIMIIGLLSKTAILITEYATERRKQGLSIKQAAISAAKIRFRPILMTVLCMIFGMLPLMFSTGVGSNGNNSLGAGVVGGILIGSIALLLFTPAFFVIFQTIQEKFKPIRMEDIHDADVINEYSEIEEYNKERDEENFENSKL